MSRTYRDKRNVLQKLRYNKFVYTGDTNWFKFIHAGPKIRRSEHCWETCVHGTTPSWWSHMTTTKRRRREGTMFEALMKQVPLYDLEYYEPPINWRKPHEYYW
jgi:hypothetical protein